MNEKEIINQQPKMHVEQHVPMPVWNMHLGTIFTKHKSGYEPATGELTIYIKISKIKCLDLTKGTKHSIPRLFGWNGCGYPISLPWIELLNALHSRQVKD